MTGMFGVSMRTGPRYLVIRMVGVSMRFGPRYLMIRMIGVPVRIFISIGRCRMCMGFCLHRRLVGIARSPGMVFKVVEGFPVRHENRSIDRFLPCDRIS